MPAEHFYLHDENSDFSAGIFDAAVTAGVKKTAGRGAIIFFEHNGQALVSRHYRRGGLPAKFSDDHYWWSGLEQTRAWREFRLLKHLETLQLPAARAYAAHVEKSGLFYRGDIVMREISDTSSLAERMRLNDLDNATLIAVGQTIRRFHDVGVDHVDLNADNILLDAADDVFLIDFDRCRIRENGRNGWKTYNLGRLLRSLEKTVPGLNPEHWREILGGYRD